MTLNSMTKITRFDNMWHFRLVLTTCILIGDDFWCLKPPYDHFIFHCVALNLTNLYKNQNEKRSSNKAQD